MLHLLKYLLKDPHLAQECYTERAHIQLIFFFFQVTFSFLLEIRCETKVKIRVDMQEKFSVYKTLTANMVTSLPNFAATDRFNCTILLFPAHRNQCSFTKHH